MKTILAKSDNPLHNQKMQSYTEHIKDVINLLYEICDKELYCANDIKIMVIIAVAHDLGKINLYMQKKLEIANAIAESNNQNEIEDLKKEKEKLKCTRHNILSGAFINMILDNIELSREDRDIIYKAVMLHHGKYEDYINISISKVQEDIYNLIEVGLFEKGEYDIESIEKFIDSVLKIDLKIDKNKIDYDYLYELNEGFKKEEDKIRYIQYKGLLNLSDHTASSGEQNIKFYNDISDDDMDKLIKENIYEKLKKQGNDIEINDIKFTPLQENLRKLSDKNVLTVAFTGAGKTVADYRKDYKKKFYLVPNKISAESFYRDSIFRNNDYIGLLNGDINLYLESDKDEDHEFRLTLRDISLSRNFCKPYIIATVDQILLSMFKFPGYEKVFAAVKGASVTVDEVHLLEPRMFIILILFIQFTCKYFNTKFHLMTATLPESYRDQMINRGFTFDNEYGKINFVESNNIRSMADEKNIICKFTDEKSIDKIIKNGLKEKNKILIIRNSIEDVNKTYELVKEQFPENDVNVLHTRFKFEDKKQKYEDILSQKGDIWISTQAVEIALDLDFPILISDMAPMDCLIQRMGRCNRHNKYEYGNFYILGNKKDVYNEQLKKITKQIITPYTKKEYTMDMSIREDILNEYYADKKVKEYYEKEFENSIREIKSIYGIMTDDFTGTDLILQFEPYKNIADNKKEAAKLFRNIDVSYKIILESDFNVFKGNVQIKCILISKGIYYKLNNMNLLKRKEGYLILIESNKYKYTQETGLILQ